MVEICDGTDINGCPCTLEARTVRFKTEFECGERLSIQLNLCSACAHDFDEDKWENERGD